MIGILASSVGLPIHLNNGFGETNYDLDNTYVESARQRSR